MRLYLADFILGFLLAFIIVGICYLQGQERAMDKATDGDRARIYCASPNPIKEFCKR